MKNGKREPWRRHGRVGPEASSHESKTRRTLHSDRCQNPQYGETSLTNRTPRTVTTPRSARKAASELNSGDPSSGLHSKEKFPSKISRTESQRRQSSTNSQLDDASPRIQQKGVLEVNTRKADSPNSVRHAQGGQQKQYYKGEDRAHTSGSSSTIRIPCSAAHESRRAKKNSKQPEIQRPRRQTRIKGAADSSAAETRGEKAIQELDGIMEFQEQASQQLRCPTRPPRSAPMNVWKAFQNERKKIVIQRWLAQYRNMQWQCPVCTEQLTLTMPWTKRTHLLQRHPLEVAKRREEEGLQSPQSGNQPRTKLAPTSMSQIRQAALQKPGKPNSIPNLRPHCSHERVVEVVRKRLGSVGTRSLLGDTKIGRAHNGGTHREQRASGCNSQQSVEGP